MTMQINATDRLANIPLLTVRKALRHIGHRNLDVERIMRYAGLSERPANLLIKELLTQGYIEHTPDAARPWYRLTNAGYRLAAASAAPRLSRATAERKVAELLERVRKVNSNPRLLYLVRRVQVFGSYLTDATTLGDVDLCIKLERKPDVTDEQEREHTFKSTRTFGTYLDQLCWPMNEVLLFLKARSRAYSFAEEIPDDAIATAKLLYELPE